MSKIEIRRLNFDFSANTERYWFKQSVFKTHLFNSVTIFIPEIEKYLIINVKKRINFIDNPQLKQQAQAFICQEGQHLHQHTKFWNILHASGYKFDTYLRCEQTILFDILERQISLNLNLAIAAGIEHLTTLMAEFALETDLFAEAEPELKQLFEWHALEEIEHKTVLYDVLENATNNYFLRQVGMFIAHILVLFFLNFGLVMLLYQDRKLFDRKVWQELIEFWITKEKFLYKALFNAINYLRKDFHPSES
ncbi:MAG: metal-dependent hydrolase [Hassallia sp. WJT32-NPBG1]|jgi:hypothetical protein|nr:metal-dependent hydrolase [Hassallia sp. WJT32-NPBG1]